VAERHPESKPFWPADRDERGDEEKGMGERVGRLKKRREDFTDR